MNKKRVGVIASACATCAVCASMIVGATYALFTSNDKVDISVTAGTVKVTAEVDKSSVKLESMGVKQEGNSWANGGTAGFTADSKLELNYITPGDAASFEIKVTNESTVKVQYRINWSVEGELADALVATANVAKFGYWTEWAIPATEEEKVKTINVSVELPESVGNEYQGKKASVSFAVEAIQGNAEVKDEVATVNGVGYETVEEALAAANDGDTVSLAGNEIYDEVKTFTIDKNISIVGNGESTFGNTHFVIGNRAVVAFENVNFEGNSYINTGAASELIMKGCKAKVAPEKFGNMGRAAFIASDQNQEGLKLTIIGNEIDSAHSPSETYSAAIFTWANIADGSVIANNTFGTENNRYNFVAVKLMNAMNNATLNLNNNTVYLEEDNGAFAIEQINTKDNALTVYSNENVVKGNGISHAKAFFIGSNSNSAKKKLVLIDKGTTVDGELINIAKDVDLDDPNYPLYINLNGDKQLSDKAEKVSTAEGFTAALNNANVSYILLGADITVSSTLAIKNNATIDLDGKTITKTANTKGNVHLIDISSGVTATIKNGNVIDDYRALGNEAAHGYVINNKGNLTVEGLNIESWNNNSSLLHNGYATMQDEGTFVAKLTVNGGTFVSHGMCALKADLCSETVINGGTFETYAGYAVECYGTLTVNDGTFVSNIDGGVALLINGGDMWDDYAYPEVTINGGDFTDADCSIEAGNGFLLNGDDDDRKIAGAVNVTVNGGKFNKIAVYVTSGGENTLTDDDSFVINGGTFEDENFPEWVVDKR